MKRQLQLTQKVLILVSVPILFMLLFVYTLNSLINQAEEAVWRERYYRQLAGTGNIILKDILEAALLLNHYKASSDQRDLERVNSLRKTITAELKTLKTLSRDDRGRLSNQDGGLEAASNDALEALNETSTSVVGNLRSDWLFATHDIRTVTTSFSRLNKVVSQLQSYCEADTAAEEQTRQRIGQVLLAGVVLSIAVALVLAIAFNRSTISRLKVMVENTRRLSKRNELLPRIPGSDELAELDQVFHDMAESLDEAARYKQELLNVVSHDLRTPITTVVGSLTILKAGVLGELSEKATRTVAQAERNLQRLVRLINDLLDFEKMEAGKLQLRMAPVVVEELFDRTVEAVGFLAQTGEIHLEYEPTDAVFKCDGDRITQVLINLCSNAIKFSPKETTIKLSARPVDGFLEFRVTDQGRGIPKEFIGKLFTKYQQVAASDSAHGFGTGLGLFICKAFVEAHGGTIGVESEEGKGSTFWFRLPLPAELPS
jgi:signal transduction histidine kinase